MAKQPESRLQKSIQDTLRKEVGGWWFKVWGGPFTPAGIPDLIGCVDGMFFALEVKLPKKSSKPSAIQIQTIRDIVTQGGGCACIVRSKEEAVSIVQQSLNLHPQTLRELIEYDPDTGEFLWKYRGRGWFESDKLCRQFNHRFAGKPAGTFAKHRSIQVFGKKYKAHRVAFAIHHGYWPPNEVDHIDRNPLNNRISNLRACDRLENSRNQSVYKNNKSGVRGVRWVNGKWQASIGPGSGRAVILGRYSMKEDAIAARRAGEKKYGY